jgi:hypothetical protein
MAPGVSATLLERLRRYRAEAFVASGPLAVRALQSELASIPVEATRDGAMRRFHILLVCASVMKRDPTNYHRAVAKAYDGLINFLQGGPVAAPPKQPGRRNSAPPFPTGIPQASGPTQVSEPMVVNPSAAPLPIPVTAGGGEGSATPFPPSGPAAA